MQKQIYAAPSLRDRITAGSAVVVVLFTIIVTGFLLLERIGVLPWILLILTLVAALTFWHSRSRAFRCRHCGHEFMITFWQDLFTINAMLFGEKMLKCPQCLVRDYHSELVKVK